MGNKDHITLNRTKRRKLKARERKVEKRFEERKKKDKEERNAARYTYKFYSSSSDDYLTTINVNNFLKNTCT